MKNALRNIIGAFALAAAAVLGVVACDRGGGNKLSGTYVSNDGTTYEFSGNKVTLALMGMKEEGTFEIKGGKYFETNSDGKITEYAYTLEGNTLTFVQGGETIVLTQK